MRKNRYSVLPGRDGGWQVKRNDKDVVFSGTRAETVRQARSLAKEGGSELIVHAKDGSIATRASFASGSRRRGSEVGAYDAKTRFSELLERVEQGEEVTITRHGAPVARLVPVKRTSNLEQRHAVVARMLKRRARLTLGTLKVKDLIAEGRR